MLERFVVDKEKKVITFEGVEFGFGLLKPNAVPPCFGLHPRHGGKGDVNKEFTKKYGMTPTTFSKMHNKLVTDLWIDPVRELSKRLCFDNSRRPKEYLMHKLHDNLPAIKQAQEDGIDNVIPLLMATGSSPEQLKKDLGKSLWKSLCKNSFTRNSHIAKLVMRLPHYYGNNLKLLNSFPSKYLKKGGRFYLDFTEASLWVVNNNLYDNTYDSPYRRHSGFIHLYGDTETMSKQLGKPFNKSWTLAQMERKHEEYTQLVNLRKFSPERLDSLEGIKVVEGSLNGYEYKLLDSRLLIANEGSEMRHCVASYIERVVSGRYLVYSITKEGKRSSTLGIDIFQQDIGKPSKYLLNQHYGFANKCIEDENEKEVAELIIKELNKEKK